MARQSSFAVSVCYNFYLTSKSFLHFCDGQRSFIVGVRFNVQEIMLRIKYAMAIACESELAKLIAIETDLNCLFVRFQVVRGKITWDVGVMDNRSFNTIGLFISEM